MWLYHNAVAIPDVNLGVVRVRVMFGIVNLTGI
jgi:hypothetical protein